jgi:hypothetical protein
MAANSKPALAGLALAILILTFISCFFDVEAQSEANTVFTSTDTFIAPGSNSTIRFAVNGSCKDITLVNGVWTFTNLRLTNSLATLNNFSISAKNSEVTIFSVRANNFTGRTNFVRFSVVGNGTQTISLNPDSVKPTHWSEWAVTVPRSGTVWLSEGQNWKLQPDSSVVVWGLTGNVSITHYVFPGSYLENNLPFYMQHSITIITATGLTAVAAVAIVIQITARRR